MVGRERGVSWRKVGLGVLRISRVGFVDVSPWLVASRRVWSLEGIVAIPEGTVSVQLLSRASTK